jgi:hypothetical protein
MLYILSYIKELKRKGYQYEKSIYYCFLFISFLRINFAQITPNKYLQFDGIDDYVNCWNDADLLISLTKITVSLEMPQNLKLQFAGLRDL